MSRNVWDPVIQCLSMPGDRPEPTKFATIVGIDNMNDYYDVVLKEYITNPDAYIMSNMIGFYNILEACRHRPVEHLVYASSSSVYGGNKKVPFSTDDRVDNPVSLYVATKKSNELFAHCYSKLYDIPTTGLRFFTVYGPAGRETAAETLLTHGRGRVPGRAS